MRAVSNASAPFRRAFLLAKFFSSTSRRTSHPQLGTVKKVESPHVGFYKTFTRPVAKVLLMATFAYQVSYWLWVKLEKDEMRLKRQDEISELEAKLQDVVSSNKRP